MKKATNELYNIAQGVDIYFNDMTLSYQRAPQLPEIITEIDLCEYSIDRIGRLWVYKVVYTML